MQPLFLVLLCSVIQISADLPFPVSLVTLSHTKIAGEKCKNDTQFYLQELKKLSLWAVQMFDSSAKFPSGLVYGATHALGNYDECLAVGRDTLAGPVRGRYCMTRVQLRPSAEFDPADSDSAHYYLSAPLQPRGRAPRIPSHVLDDPEDSVWFKIQRSVMDPSQRRRDVMWWGICVPDSCDIKDVHAHVAQALAPLRMTLGIEATTHVERCEEPTESSLDAPAIFMISLFAVAIFAVAFCSAYDAVRFIKTKKRDVWQANATEEVILCFSLYRNLKRLNSSEPDEHRLKCMHGIKLYSMCCVILGHRLMYSLGSPIINAEYVETYYHRFDTMILLNGFIIVDTFFTITGFLVSYQLISTFHQGIRVPMPALYFHRFLRLTPVYAIVLGVYATLFKYMGSGPIWATKVGVEVERCQENWWTNLLYVNNYINTEHMCMFQSWYVACDMHLFIISAPIVWLLYSKPRTGRAVLGLAILISAAIPFAITIWGHLDALLLLYMNTLEDPVRNQTFRWMYAPTHVRGSPYFVGMAFGYLTFLHRTQRFTLSRRSRRLCWFLLSLLPPLSMLSAWIFYLPGRQYMALEAALYGSLHRIGWSLGISWVVFAVCTGGKGIVRLILSMKPVIALSRLSYCAFISHAAMQLFSVATMRNPAYISILTMAWMTSGDIMQAYISALFLNILFEAPILGLEKILLRRKIQEAKSKAAARNSVSLQTSSENSESQQIESSTVDLTVKGFVDPVQFTASQDPDSAFLGIPRAHFCNVISGQRVTDSTSSNSQY